MQIERAEDYAALTLPEMVVIFGGAEEIKGALQSLYDEEYYTIVLDFTHVIMIDTAGLSSLLVYQQRLKARGGTLKIINITSKYIREMFKTIKLDTVITIEEE